MENEKKHLDKYDKYSSEIVSRNDLGFQAFSIGISLNNLSPNSMSRANVFPFNLR